MNILQTNLKSAFDPNSIRNEFLQDYVKSYRNKPGFDIDEAEEDTRMMLGCTSFILSFDDWFWLDLEEINLISDVVELDDEDRKIMESARLGYERMVLTSHVSYDGRTFHSCVFVAEGNQFGIDTSEIESKLGGADYEITAIPMGYAGWSKELSIDHPVIFTKSKHGLWGATGDLALTMVASNHLSVYLTNACGSNKIQIADQIQ